MLREISFLSVSLCRTLIPLRGYVQARSVSLAPFVLLKLHLRGHVQRCANLRPCERQVRQGFGNAQVPNLERVVGAQENVCGLRRAQLAGTVRR
jgi:hypothetical protein